MKQITLAQGSFESYRKPTRRENLIGTDIATVLVRHACTLAGAARILHRQSNRK